MPKRIDLDEKLVINMYHELKNAADVGRHYTCSQTPILRILKLWQTCVGSLK